MIVGGSDIVQDSVGGGALPDARHYSERNSELSRLFCPPKSGPVNERIVAGMNSMTAKYANQIYSAAPDFVCLLPTGLGHVKDVIELLKGGT